MCPRGRIHSTPGASAGRYASIVAANPHASNNSGNTNVVSSRMFDLGERMWPEEAPFHTPVFVLTSEVRAPWVRPGGTTFHFVNDGIGSALRQARAVAGERDVRISGGADVIGQSLRAGLVDEFALALSPVMFAGGPRLFAGVGRDVAVELVETIASPRTTHVRYAVRKR